MTEKNETKRKTGEGSWGERHGGLIFGIAVFGALALVTLVMWIANA
jgi:hypothetical protein